MKMRVLAEDERFVLENDFDTFIPVNFTIENQDIQLECYPCVESIVRDWVDLFHGEWLTDKSLSFLWTKISPIMNSFGYYDDKFRDRWGYIYRGFTTKTAVDAVKKLKRSDEKKNKTTYDIEASMDDGCLMYGIKENDYVVSIACTHSRPYKKMKVCEVGVETIPKARGKHYATLCLIALSQDLEKKGIVTEYRCQRYNIRSKKVAEQAGLQTVGYFYYYVGRKKNGI